MSVSDIDDDRNSEDELIIKKSKKRTIVESDDEAGSVISQESTDRRRNSDSELKKTGSDDDFGEENVQRSDRHESDVEYEEADSDSIKKDKSSSQSQKKKRIVYNSDRSDGDESSDEVRHQVTTKDSSPVKKKYIYDPSIYDAEYSDSDGSDSHKNSSKPQNGNERQEEAVVSDGETSPVTAKSKHGANKSKPITEKKKERKVKAPSHSENMREIRRESQRMLRESHFSLPYHIPKQRTLAEFLNRRKSAPSIPIKTTTEQLTVLSEQIVKFEKDSEEFFKSDDSDCEDPNDRDYIPGEEEGSGGKISEKNCSPSSNDNRKENVDSLPETEAEMVDKTDGDSVMCTCRQETSSSGSAVLKPLCTVHNGRRDSQIDLQDSSDGIGTSDLLNRVSKRLCFENENDGEAKQPSGVDLNSKSNSEEPLKNTAVATGDFDVSAEPSKPDHGFHSGRHMQQPKGADDDAKEIDPLKCFSEISLSKNNSVDGELNINRKSSDEIGEKNVSPVCDKSDNTLPADSDEFSFVLRLPEDSEKITEEVEGDGSVEISLEKDKKKLSLSENLRDKYFKGGAEEETSDGYSCAGKDLALGVNKTTRNNLLPKFEIDLSRVPMLSGNRKGEIDLDSPPKKNGGISDLKKRFFEHFTMEKKKKAKPCAEVSVVSVQVNDSGHIDSINKETVVAGAAKQEERWLDDIKDTDGALPGAKLTRLKAHLETQLKARWKEEWERRVREHQMNEEEIDGDEKADYEHEAILDDEDEEVELTDSSSEEEEEEEDDVKLVDKKRMQSQFVDDEAEVSEDEEEEEEKGSRKGSEEEESDIEEDEEDLLGNNEISEREDSNSDSEKGDEDGLLTAHQTISSTKKKKKKRRLKKDASDEDDEEEEEEDDGRGNESKGEEESPGLISPVFRLTALDGKCITVSSEQETTQSSQQSLFSQAEGGIEKLLDKESGESGELTQHALADLCSGKFPSQPVAWSQSSKRDTSKSVDSNTDIDSQLVEDSQDFSLAWPDDTENAGTASNKIDERKSKRPDASFLSDDEEEEEEEEVVGRSVRKKKHKKVKYSDDEDEDEEKVSGDEKESDNDGGAKDEYSEEEEIVDEIGGEEMEEAEYDSEENEVVRDPRAFFEKEAVLSDSEWDSEDEDEKDLDALEAEAGDEDDIDQDKLNAELGKIRMQQMLVEDKREVRILQELLLEDGELHDDGSGRVRQFRWANSGEDFAGENRIKDSDDDDSDQGDGDEENWRKVRHERELFLQKKNVRMKELGIDDDEEEADDGLLQMGRAALKKMQTTFSKPPATTKVAQRNGTGLDVIARIASARRGSFLSSSNQYLSRLAVITNKVGTEGNVNGPKNSRNFVFSIVSPPKDEDAAAEEEDKAKKVKKRKADVKVENAKKKIHFADQNGNEGQQRRSLLEMLN